MGNLSWGGEELSLISDFPDGAAHLLNAWTVIPSITLLFILLDPEATQQPLVFTTFSRLIFSDVILAYCLFPFSYCFPDTHVFLFLILSRVFIFLNQERTLRIWYIAFSKWNLFQCHWFAVDFLFSVHQCIILLGKATTLLFTTVFDLFINLFIIIF